MRSPFERSLLLRLGAAMAAITVLALVSMGSSVFIAEMMKGEAAAINQAGSLRMQSYRIGTELLAPPGAVSARRLRDAVADFESRLRSPRLTDALPGGEHALRAAYDRIVANWARTIEPAIAAHLAGTGSDPGAAEHALSLLHGFVLEIDGLVKQLEDAAEAKINLLRLIQGFALFLTFGIAYVTMYFMQTEVVTRLKDLLGFAARASRGDFSRRPTHVGEDELGRLGQAFDVMARDLSKLYADLESRVALKTADLARTNRSLELLYHVAYRLNAAPLSGAVYNELLEEIEKAIGLGPGIVCLSGAAGDAGSVLASTCADPALLKCGPEHCADCLATAGAGLRNADDMPRSLSVELRDARQAYGVMLLGVPPGREVEPWQLQLAETIGRNMGVAIGAALRATESRRLSLLEERSVIARELHDSLAQSLSYLKIQLSRLQTLLARGAPRPDIDAVLGELGGGLSDAYRQLRELLTTFRLKVDGRGLGAALEETVAEFRERGGVAMTLDNRLGGCPLTVDEEIHILQIVREALSNVVRHAHAGAAGVTLSWDETRGEVEVTVSDDGVGLPPQAERRHHYGLAIMQERARSLGGSLEAAARPAGGTRVALRFLPANRRESLVNTSS